MYQVDSRRTLPHMEPPRNPLARLAIWASEITLGVFMFWLFYLTVEHLFAWLFG